MLLGCMLLLLGSACSKPSASSPADDIGVSDASGADTQLQDTVDLETFEPCADPRLGQGCGHCGTWECRSGNLACVGDIPGGADVGSRCGTCGACSGVPP